MARKGISMSLADAEAHQARHFGATLTVGAPQAPEPVKVPKPRQNSTEREFGLILEAMKRRGEIMDYRPFGIKLEWGADPVTGKPQIYSPDFLVINDEETLAHNPGWKYLVLTLVEVKGGYIYPQDLIRFRGCRAEWGKRFEFQMHQKSEGTWRRVY